MYDFTFGILDAHIGDFIRKYIKSHDITRQQLAEMLGVSNSKVDRILQSRTIDTTLLFDICKKLNINIFAFYTGGYNEKDKGDTLYNYDVGKSVEVQLKISGMSQKQLAEKIGVKQPVISKIIKHPSIDTGRLIGLCYALNHNFFRDFFNHPEKIIEDYKVKYDELIEKYNLLLIENEKLRAKLYDLVNK